MTPLINRSKSPIVGAQNLNGFLEIYFPPLQKNIISTINMSSIGIPEKDKLLLY